MQDLETNESAKVPLVPVTPAAGAPPTYRKLDARTFANVRSYDAQASHCLALLALILFLALLFIGAIVLSVAVECNAIMRGKTHNINDFEPGTREHQCLSEGVDRVIVMPSIVVAISAIFIVVAFFVIALDLLIRFGYFAKRRAPVLSSRISDTESLDFLRSVFRREGDALTVTCKAAGDEEEQQLPFDVFIKMKHARGTVHSLTAAAVVSCSGITSTVATVVCARDALGFDGFLGRMHAKLFVDAAYARFENGTTSLEVVVVPNQGWSALRTFEALCEVVL